MTSPVPGRMRVLHVIDSLDRGGAEVSLVQMLPGLRTCGVDSHVAVLRDSPASQTAEVRGQGTCVTVLGGRGPWRAIRPLNRLIREVAPDLVHAVLFDASLAARVAAHHTGVPAVCSVVNTPYAPEAMNAYSAPWKKHLVRTADRFLARHRTAAFHAITEAAAAAAVRELRVDRARVVVIPRGRASSSVPRPTPDRRRRLRDSLGIPPDAKVLLAVGRQERQKGHVLLVDALPAILAKHPEAVLLLAGRPGRASADIHAAVSRLGLEDHVRLLGERRDVADLLGASELMVLPSLWEGFGGVLLEAMATETPVVAFDVPAVVEVLGGTGWLVARGDSAALARGVGHVLDNPADAAARATQAAARFTTNYDMSAVAASMAFWYREIAAR